MKYGALEVMIDGRVQDIVLLLQEVNLFGREFGDFILDDEEASAEHCQIQKIGDQYHLFDRGSTNGTSLNEKKVLKSKLRVGDLIRIGHVSLRFLEVSLASEPEPNEVLVNWISSLPKPTGISAGILQQIEEIRDKVLANSTLVLDVIYEDGNRQVLKFPTGCAELGRQTERGKFQNDHELSKLHAVIRVVARGEMIVADQGSTNGTFVNEKRLVGECKVVPGDTIRIGRTRVWCRPEIQI